MKGEKIAFDKILFERTLNNSKKRRNKKRKGKKERPRADFFCRDIRSASVAGRMKKMVNRMIDYRKLGNQQQHTKEYCPEIKWWVLWHQYLIILFI